MHMFAYFSEALDPRAAFEPVPVAFDWLDDCVKKRRCLEGDVIRIYRYRKEKP
jgi:hypothetical protein